jgi:adenylate cyclase
VVFEQAEQRRVKGIFSKVVSPKIMVELLRQKTLLLGGARREVTVFFADVRGFTEMTDSRQDEAAEFVRRHNLSGPEAEAYFDDHARETLRTVSAYLALVAEMVSKHDGTLDKYIGDCVMAFWGAPVPDPKHALACVRAAIDAQHGVYELNRQRVIQNKQIELENLAQTSAGLPPKPLLPILTLGTGINTGMVTVGLMGSDAHGSNYTVFGREVNLASRLESASGRGRIFVSEATYKHLRAHDPALAATCLELPPIHVKGIRTAVNVYEVPWRPPGSPPLEEEFSVPAVDAASLTGFVQRGSA